MVGLNSDAENLTLTENILDGFYVKIPHSSKRSTYLVHSYLFYAELSG